MRFFLLDGRGRLVCVLRASSGGMGGMGCG